MSAAANKAVVRRAIQETTHHCTPSTIEELYVSDYWYTPPTVWQPSAPTVVIEATQGPEAALSDAHYRIEEMIAEGDTVVTRWTVCGTHRGTLPSPVGPIPPSGKQLRVTGVTIDHLREGKLAHSWTAVDWIDALQQLGVSPSNSRPSSSANGARPAEHDVGLMRRRGA